MRSILPTETTVPALMLEGYSRRDGGLASVPAMVCVVGRGCCRAGDGVAVAGAVDSGGSCLLLAVVDRHRWEVEADGTLNRAN